MEKIPIMIIDDHTLIRDTWSMIFNIGSKYEVIADTGDGKMAVEIAREKKPELILLDINMAPLNGFDILKLIRKYLPGVKVIAVSIHDQPAYAKKMFRGGAKGYVTKNSSIKEFMKAIEEVLEGRIYLCNEVRSLFVDQSFSSDSASSVSNLSERELEIIKYIRDGLSSREIAERIHIATRTVDVHRHNIIKKLKVRNSASLIEHINVYGLLV